MLLIMKKIYAFLGLSLGVLLVVSGCESVSFSTNLDPQNFKDYYKPSMVELLSREDLNDHVYKSLGAVHGLSCQENDLQMPANEADARTDLKIKAADMGANALVVDKCVRVEHEDGVCKVSVTCYGQALVIDK